MIDKIQFENYSPEEKLDFLESFHGKEINDDEVKFIASLLMHDDLAVRNKSAVMLSSSDNPLTPSILSMLISSKEIYVRNLSGEILVNLGEKATRALVNHLPSSNADDQKFIIDLLGLIKDTSATEAILKVLHKSENENVILACFETLGNFASDDYVDVLIEFYDKNEVYKAGIIDALLKIGSPKVLDFIQTRYSDEDELTKFLMLECLGVIGDEKTFFFLLSEVTQLKEPLIWPAISSLRKLKDKLGYDIPFDEKMKNAVMKTLNHGGSEYKKDAARLIFAFDDRDVIIASLNVLGEDAELDEELKGKLFEHSTLIFTKIPELISKNPKNLKSLVYLTRELFVNDPSLPSFLSNIEIRNICNAFSNCLDNSDEEIRRVAMEMLFVLSRETALLYIDKMMYDDSFWNRLRLVEILGSYIDEESAALLQKLADDPDEMVREKVTEILETNN
ncbi:MAG: hypothetical protein C0425_11445 [Chlorobiaceae bacterium]|nr:hypothetical protein [Chlorobiaceae bacterium]MBA4310929.1 hypothetical protein [Chlorobiaceae bacterium]